MIEEGDLTANVTSRDIIIKKHTPDPNKPFTFIKETLSIYDPLSYTLMFIFGQGGWQYKTIQKIKKVAINLPVKNTNITTVDDVDELNDDQSNNQNNNENENNENTGDPTDDFNFENENLDAGDHGNANASSNIRYISCREFYAHKLHKLLRPRRYINV